jgi:pimeloyl-ACP methyl ester carboxylesterase
MAFATRRPAAGFLAGLALLPLGVGIGVPHLAKAGLRLATVLGAAALIAALALLGAAGFLLVRATPRWWRLLVLPALVLAPLLVSLVLGQAVAATNVPRTSVGPVTPADRGLTYAEARFSTADGVALSGWYVPSTNGAAVVLLHGAGSTRASVLRHATVLARHGYGVLLFDARGHGRSEGRAMDFGWYGDADTAAALSFLERQPGVDPARLGAVGLSMGGEEAIGAAAGDARIRAVVAEGATNRVAADKAWLSNEFGWRGTVQRKLEWAVYAAADLLTAADPPGSLRDAVVAAAPRPVLLIAAGGVPDEPRADRWIRSASPATVDLWVVRDAGHTDGLRTHPLEWEARVTAFLDRALLGA